MKKSFFLLSISVIVLLFTSCDQDENLNDGWDSNEVYSIVARTRSIDVETEPAKMPYILPGYTKEKYTIIRDSASIDFEISWPGGFTWEDLKLTVTDQEKCVEPYSFAKLEIVNKSLSNYKASFVFWGALVNKVKQDTIRFIDEISVNVQSEEREITTPNNKTILH